MANPFAAICWRLREDAQIGCAAERSRLRPLPHAARTARFPHMKTLGVAIIGCGGITLQNHLPGLALCAETKLVALCDTNPATLEQASRDTGVTVTSARYEAIVGRDDVHAVIIATPNVAHGPIA